MIHLATAFLLVAAAAAPAEGPGPTPRRVQVSVAVGEVVTLDRGPGAIGYVDKLGGCL